MRVVVALGGNALLRRGERPDAEVQQRDVAVAAAVTVVRIIAKSASGVESVDLRSAGSATAPALDIT